MRYEYGRCVVRRCLSTQRLSLFQGMTFPACRELLDLQPRREHAGAEHQVHPVAVVATYKGAPAGLGLAALLRRQPASSALLSIYLVEDYRGTGVGKQILQTLEDELRNEGCSVVVCTYAADRFDVETLERVLQAQEWAVPELGSQVAYGFVREAMSAPWLSKHTLRSGLDLFLWKELSAHERAGLRRTQAAAGWIPKDLEPWQYDKSCFEVASSLGVRYRGQVVGWIINQEISSDFACCRCSYIRDDLRRCGRIVPVFMESLRRAEAAGYSRFTFTVPAHHTRMRQFLQRRWAPYISRLREVRRTLKSL